MLLPRVDNRSRSSLLSAGPNGPGGEPCARGGRRGSGSRRGIVADRTAAASSQARDRVSGPHEERDELWQAVLRLPPRQRACIALRYYEDLPEREVAAILSCSVGTVKKQSSRALAQ